MPELPDPILYAIPGFVALVAAEIVFASVTGRARFEPRDTATSLVMGLGNTVSGIVFGVVSLTWFALIEPFAVLDIGWTWWAWALCFVLDDFVYYWSHRAAHRVRWFWAEHVIHHSSQHYNLSTALRQPWTYVFTLKFVFFGSWLVLAGFPIGMIAFVGALNLIYQFWIHTEAIGRTPAWFEAVMNTPSHHRVHHATNPRYLDKNYAGVFIVWDKMFATFEPERDDEPCRYGIVHNLGTYNPLRVAFHEWIGMGRDLVSSRSLSEALAYVFRPPGWSPDGSRETTDTIKARWRARIEEAESQAPPTPAE